MNLPFSLPTKDALRTASSYYLRGLYREIAAKQLFLWAQAIAFKVLVTLVPIVILATGIAGRILQGDDTFATVIRFIHDFLPPSQSGQVVSFLEQLQEASLTIVGVGGIGLFLSAVSLFITLRIAVSNAFEQEWHEGRSLIGGYLFDVRMVLQVGFFFLLTLGMSILARSVQAPELLSTVGLSAPWLLEGWQQTIHVLGLFLPFIVTMAMFFQLYYFVPNPHPRKRSAFTGAFIASVLWEAAKQAFAYYATYVSNFDELAVLGNTFGLIIAFVFWVYFSGIVLMIGAVIASLREHRHVTAGRLPGEPLLADDEETADSDAVDGESAAGDTESGDGHVDPEASGDAAPDPTASRVTHGAAPGSAASSSDTEAASESPNGESSAEASSSERSPRSSPENP